MGIKVRCVDDSMATQYIKVGEVYELDHETSDYYYLVCNYSGGWNKSRFEIIPDRVSNSRVARLLRRFENEHKKTGI